MVCYGEKFKIGRYRYAGSLESLVARRTYVAQQHSDPPLNLCAMIFQARMPHNFRSHIQFLLNVDNRKCALPIYDKNDKMVRVFQAICSESIGAIV